MTTKKRNACPHADTRDMGYNTDGDHLLLCRKCNEVLVERCTRRVATPRQRRSMVV